MKLSTPYSILIILSIWCMPLISFGQVTLMPKPPQSRSVGVIYDREFAVNVYLHTKGYGLGMQFGDIETYYKTSFYFVDFSMIRHPKEHKPSNQITQIRVLSRPYVYGKQNSFFSLRAGKGMKRYLSEKTKRRGVAMAYSYQVGPAIGILKPYYLDLLFVEAGSPQRIESTKYSEENEDLFLNTNFIDGYSGFWQGIDELKFTFGGHAKAAAHFSWGAYEEFVKALELGIMVDFYFQRVPIMVIEKNSPVFINLYLNLQFGRRR